MEKSHKTKVAHEKRESGICPEESEFDLFFEDHDWENEKLWDKKKKKAEDVTKGEEMREQSLETFKEPKEGSRVKCDRKRNELVALTQWITWKR